MSGEVNLDAMVPPEGFVAAPTRGPFTTHNGPVFVRQQTDAIKPASALPILRRHCNGLGFMHGGMIAAFADSSLAHAIIQQTGRACVTLNMSIEYFDAIHVGSWLIGEPEILSVENEIAHVEVKLMVENRLKARATGVFRLRRLRTNKKRG